MKDNINNIYPCHLWHQFEVEGPSPTAGSPSFVARVFSSEVCKAAHFCLEAGVVLTPSQFFRVPYLWVIVMFGCVLEK